MARLRRLPIRVKMTIALVALLSITLAVFGLGVYLHTKASLDDVIRRELVGRAADIAAAQTRSGDRVPPRDRVAQILSRDGRVLAGHPGTAALSRREVARARQSPFFIDRSEAVRIYARPGRRGTIIVDGISLHQREHALESLAAALLIGGPVGVMVAGAAVFLIMGIALRPVEEMRRRAAAAEDPSVRLPLPEADDEIRRLGETLNHLLARVEAAVAHEKAFVGDASHQLRTPLAVLRAELDLARGGADVPERVQAALENAITDTDKLAEVVSQLLLLARADEGALQVDLDEIDLTHIARAVTSRHDLASPKGNRVIAIGDAQLVEQALENLISNALQHGGGAPEVTVRTSDGYAFIVVTDSGPGFPIGFLPRALDRFAQADPAAGGTGLGLAVARALAEAQAGSITLRNRSGGGAEAVVRLRAAQQQDAPSGRAPGAPRRP